RRELNRRGVTVVVLAFAQVTQPLRDELHAMPFFRAYTYWQTDNDPIAGWLNSFDNSVRATIQDLQRLQGVTPDDIIYLNSAQPAQFMALVQWAQSRPLEQRPHVVMEFGTDPGVDVTFAPNDPDNPTLRLRDYRTDPRAMFYRHAACQLTDQDLARFHMVTFDPAASAIYATLLGHPVGVLPLPQTAATAVIPRTARRPITVSVLGHQRPDKGYHLMPQVARMLLAHEPGITLLVHNGAPNDMPDIQADLRAQAATNPSLVLNEQVAGPTLWQDLLNRSDLILCPYQPSRFAASYSAVATEALANAIPLVVPADTALSRLLQRYGRPGATFASHDPAGIVAATRHALANFNTLATRAAAAADQWNTTMGVTNMVSALLAKAAA
ncbi:MAG TPA: glycosyltransferase family 1 protein, partial [Rhodopila sp.]|nr:glycosyltransferase family 1 protein [Rhodopila sp.]